MLPLEPQREPKAPNPSQQITGENVGAVSDSGLAPGRVAGSSSSPERLLPTASDGPTCTINMLSLPSLLREDIEDAPFWKEVVAFAHMPHSEIEPYDKQYVAIYNGNIVDSDPDEGELALRFYRTYGYVPVYIHFVGVEDALLDVYD